MNKLAIVNGSPSSEMLAPFDDPEYDIWVLGNRIDHYPIEHVDLIFEIHDDLSKHDEGYPLRLASLGKPLVVGEKFPLSEGVRFPYDDAEKMFGSTYLTSSTVYMIAYALLNNYKHIRLFGVDMAVDDHEYFWQRPCLEMWIGFARGMGVDIECHKSSPVGKSDYVEGRHFGAWQPETPFPANEYADIAKEHRGRMESAQAELNKLEGAINYAEQLKATIQGHSGAAQAYERMAKVQRAKDSGQKIETLKDTLSIR